MYGMNFAYGNNFGFGGFGGFGCCCRPNPFVLGYMRAYISAKIGYAMMGSVFNTPSIYGMYNQPQIQQSYQNMPQATDYNVQPPSYSTYIPDAALNSRYEEASRKWQEALAGRTAATSSASTASTARTESMPADTVTRTTTVKSKDFKERVEQIAQTLVCDPDDLLALMNSESGLMSDAVNKSGRGAVGLIQFTSPAIEELNRHGIKITKEELLNMSPVEQLDYVEAYLQIAKSYKFSADHPLSAGDLYAINYLPGRAGVEHLASRGDKYYEANKGLDIDGDGIISKSDLAKRLDNFRVSLVA